MSYIISSILIIFNFSFKNTVLASNTIPDTTIVDSNATKETKALYFNLKSLSPNHTLIGQEDALAYGIGWKEEVFESDIHKVVGKHPALFGWDLGGLGKAHNLDSVNFDKMRQWIIKAFEQAGVNTISWHMENPVTGGSSWDASKAIKNILPGGNKHDYFKQQLDLAAEFFLSLKDSKGTLVPIIFRPFHENDAAWFWWGEPHTSQEEFITLWKFTVKYLRDVKQVHNLLYAYSYGAFQTESEYLKLYPGDEWVDVLGTDIYGAFGEQNDELKNLTKLKVLGKLAIKKNKVAALTEGGMEKIPQTKFWTEKLLKPIKNDPYAKNIAYILLWRNANANHYFGPYPNHPSVKDFKKFERDDYTFFLGDKPSIYNFQY